MRSLVKIMVGMLFPLSFSVFGQDEGGATHDKDDMNIKMSGYFLWDGGFVKEFQDKDSRNFYNEPFAGLVGGLKLSARPDDNLYLMINPEIAGSSPFPILPGIVGSPAEGQQAIRWNIGMSEGKTVWTMGGTPDRPHFQNTLGLMVYKENPDTKIFGDYLFRSQIYPTMITTKFNYPQTEIFGLHVKNNIGEMFSHNLVINSDFQHYPLYDISLAYAADLNFKNMVQIGLAVNFRSIIPMRPSRTTPGGGEGEGLIDNTYKYVPFTKGDVEVKNAKGLLVRKVSITAAGVEKDTMGNPLANFTITEYDSLGVAGSTTTNKVKVAKRGGGIEGLAGGVNDVIPGLENILQTGVPSHQYDLLPQFGGENVRYSFAGQIFTARVAVNPLGYMETNPLCKNALKVYTEVAVLGWKNYPLYYENRRERIPMMVGINLPTMNFLDFLTFEYEYFPSKEIPTTWQRYQKNVPRPGAYTHKSVETEWAKPGRRSADDNKWGLIAKRSFRAFAFVGMIGSDHMRRSDIDGMAVSDQLTRTGVPFITKNQDWYAQVRFITGFY